MKLSVFKLEDEAFEYSSLKLKLSQSKMKLMTVKPKESQISNFKSHQTSSQIPQPPTQNLFNFLAQNSPRIPKKLSFPIIFRDFNYLPFYVTASAALARIIIILRASLSTKCL
jgi:spore cortex formation protein SpoVR/YcgB (stage V sporulation)